MKKTLLMALAFCSISFMTGQAHSNKQDVPSTGALMQQLGESFSSIKQMVILNGDLGEDTRREAQKLENLFYLCLKAKLDFLRLVSDEGNKGRPEVLYKKLMSESLSLSYELELKILDGDLDGTKDVIRQLSQKRNEAHDIFKQ